MIRLKNKTLLLSVMILAAFVVSMGCKKKKTPEEVMETGTLTDRQGNVYATVKIGDQWWMAENLRVKVYNDSTPIAEVLSGNGDTAWAKRNIGAFCLLADPRSGYGLHYNWFAISDPRRLAPAGWHIPSDEEWKALEKELGMSQEEADKTAWRGSKESEKLITKASTGWSATGSTVFGTNESGFSALPGGCRLFNGTIGDVAVTGYWWSSTQTNPNNAWYRNVSSSREEIFRYHADKNYGLTVRCVKDN